MHALMAQQGAMDATTNNIANANTPGYSRQVPVLTAVDPTYQGSLVFGNGVALDKFQSIRDELLDFRIQEETSQQGSADAQASATQQIEALFSSSGQDIGSRMSAFFSGISKLSADAANMSLRTQVLTAGQNLAQSFHAAVAQLTEIQQGLNGSVVQNVEKINQLAQQIAGLNTQMVALQAAGQDGGTVKDRQTELIRQLSQLTSVSVIQTESGISVTTGSGTALTVGNDVFPLQTSTGSDGMEHVWSQGQDISATLQGGALGGNLEVRDQVIPQILNQLDTLASEFSAAFNTAHQQGTDLAGNAGSDFFMPLNSVIGAAANISVALTDPSAIAASSDGSAGGNGNLAGLLAVQTCALPSGQNPTDSYSNVVFQVGSIAAQAQAESDATAMSLTQLADQRSALSGVSINEESVNLIRYQQAFEAAARVITTIDQLNQVALNMGVTNGGY
jgi:flagellar hook-associated protein 1 FlgK